MDSTPSFRERFQTYFEREVAAKAAAPLANGVEIELRVAEHGQAPAEGDVFTFTKSTDANKRIAIQLKAGFLTLFSKGYFGVVTAGGAQFASFLATRGLSGMSAI